MSYKVPKGAGGTYYVGVSAYANPALNLSAAGASLTERAEETGERPARHDACCIARTITPTKRGKPLQSAAVSE